MASGRGARRGASSGARSLKSRSIGRKAFTRADSPFEPPGHNLYCGPVTTNERTLNLESMSAGMLIAVPQLRDPFFSKTVVLLVEHNKDGAYGVVLNRKAPVDFRTLLDGAGLPTRNVPENKPVWWGGPVHPESGMVLYEHDDRLVEYEPGFAVGDRLRVSWSLDLLHDIANGKGPQVFALFLGRASWGAGQLDNEIANGAWLPSDSIDDLLFKRGTNARWRDALSTLGVQPGYVAPGAPAEA